MRRTLINAVVLLSTVVFALTASAGPVDTDSNKWFEFKFGEPGTWDGACTDSTCNASLAENSVYLGDPA